MSIKKPSVPGLDRGFKVLETLVETEQGLTLSMISKKMNIPTNGVYRIIDTLMDLGYLIKTDKHYKVAPKLLGLAYKSINLKDQLSTIIPYCQEAVFKINETVLLGQLSGSQGIVVYQTVGTHPVKVSVSEGTIFNLHSSSPGKAILSALSFLERKRICKNINFCQSSPNTILDSNKLLSNIADQSAKGYFIDDEEDLLGVRCVGVPILDHRDVPIYAIWTTGPKFRLTDAKIAEYGNYLKLLSKNISLKLGAL